MDISARYKTSAIKRAVLTTSTTTYAVVLLGNLIVVAFGAEIYSRFCYFAFCVVTFCFVIKVLVNESFPADPWYAYPIVLFIQIFAWGGYFLDYTNASFPFVYTKILEIISIGVLIYFCLGIYVRFEHNLGLRGFSIDVLFSVFAVTTALVLVYWSTITTFFQHQDVVVTLTWACWVITLTAFVLALSILIVHKGSKRYSRSYFWACLFIVMHFTFELLSYTRYQDSVWLVRAGRVCYDVASLFGVMIMIRAPRALVFQHPGDDSIFESEKRYLSFTLVAFALVLALPVVAFFVNESSEHYAPRPLILVTIVLSITLAFFRFASLTRSFFSRHGELRTAALHDQLTGLLNRLGLQQKVRSFQKRGNDSVQFTVAYIDINELSDINNTYGHSAGDRVLVALSQTLQNLPNVLAVTRIGGDEFVVVFGRVLEEVRTSKQLEKSIKQSVHYKDKTIELAVSVGLVKAKAHTILEAIDNADKEMYRSK